MCTCRSREHAPVRRRLPRGDRNVIRRAQMNDGELAIVAGSPSSFRGLALANDLRPIQLPASRTPGPSPPPDRCADVPDARRIAMIELHQGLADAIAAAKLLAGLGTDSRAALVDAAQTAVFRPGEPLFPEGCGADALYVIRDGTFHAVEPELSKEPRVVRILGPGDVVDGVIEFAGERRPVTVRSVGEGVAAVIPGVDVDRLVGIHADLRSARERLHRLQLLSGLSSIFGPIDAELLEALEAEADWLHLHRGEVLWEPCAPADGL